MSSLAKGILGVVTLRREQALVTERYAELFDRVAIEAGLGRRYVARTVDFPLEALRERWENADDHFVRMKDLNADPKEIERSLLQAFKEISKAEAILKTFVTTEVNELLRRTRCEVERIVTRQHRNPFRDATNAVSALNEMTSTANEDPLTDLIDGNLITLDGCEAVERYLEKRIRATHQVMKRVQPIPAGRKILIVCAVLTVLLGALGLVFAVN